MSTGLLVILLMLLPLALWAGWTITTIAHAIWMHWSNARQERSDLPQDE